MKMKKIERWVYTHGFKRRSNLFPRDSFPFEMKTRMQSLKYGKRYLISDIFVNHEFQMRETRDMTTCDNH